jgi:hypothetical protein
VAQTDTGRVGHVAWVSAVGDGTVTVEEYNYYVAGGYDVRTVPASDFRYLHLADVAPNPGLGSTRAAATTAAPGGGSWVARTTEHRGLTVTPTSGPAVHLGARVAWSDQAAPSITADTRGRTWVAAVTAGGRVITAHTRGDTNAWTRLRPIVGGPWSTTATPTLALDGQGQVRLLTVSAAGDLVQRHTTSRTDRWSHGDRMGAGGSWSPFAAPTATTDARGRLWVAAVTRRGGLEVLHTLTQGHRSTRFQPVDRRTWSETSTPALTLADDGRLWLTSVSSHGVLWSRHTDAGLSRWHRPAPAPGQWSPYSSPATTVDTAGRLWLAAVRTDGGVVVRSTAPRAVAWHAPRTLRTGSEVTSSPTLVAPQNGSVRIGLVSATGRPVWRPAGAPGGFLLQTPGPRAGAFSGRPALPFHA